MPSLLSKKDDTHEFLPILAEIEDEPTSPLARVSLYLILATLVFFLAWSIIGEVDKVITAQGKVIPDGHAKILQPLDTGVVSRILVKEGDYVKQGQVLMEIDPSMTADELRANNQNYKYTKLEIDRLQATISGTGFVANSTDNNNEAAQAQTALYLSARESLTRDLHAKQEELAKNEEEKKQAAADRQKNQDLLDNALEKQKRLAPVIDLIARDEWDKNENDVVTYRSNVDQADHKLQELDHKKEQLRSEMAKIEADFRSSNLQDLSRKQKDAVELDGKVRELTFKHSKQALKAPTDGYIDAVYVHTIGGVVTPAEKLMSIIPANIPVIVNASVSNQDIGFVEPGMPVQIKADTFDFQKYGMYEGKVKLIARDSHDDEKKQTSEAHGTEKKLDQVYEVYVAPTKSVLKIEGKDQPLTPGMTVCAEIKVGKRRIIEFFIYPLIKYWHDGISVR